MILSAPSFKLLKSFQKRAIVKVAIELVKADNLIHFREVGLLDSLCDKLGLKQEDVESVHYLTLESAIRSICGIPSAERRMLYDFYSTIVRVDDDIAFDERLLLSSLFLSFNDGSREWCRLISIPDSLPEFSQRQIVYLEKKQCDCVHTLFADKYELLLISKAFEDAGFDFFYLPRVLKELKADGEGSDRFSLLAHAMGYMVPVDRKASAKNIESALSALDTQLLYRLILSKYEIDPDYFKFDSFLLVKIKDSNIFNDAGNASAVSDFLCIDISSNIKERVLTFLSYFDSSKSLISYEGCYKFLFDYLCSESQITEPLVIHPDGAFTLGAQVVSFESAPQAKTLYLTLLQYGKRGVDVDAFSEASNLLQKYGGDGVTALCQAISRLNTEASNLLLKLIRIYGLISTKEIDKPDFLNYVSNIIAHRSSLKNYINRGFASMPKGTNASYFNITYLPENKSYSIQASRELISNNFK